MSASTYSFRQKKSFSFLVIILTFVMLLAGCGNQSSQEASKSSESKGTEQTEQEEATENAREITHAMGITKIEGTPERIVTLYQGASDAAAVFGVKPVGAVESWLQQPIYDYLKSDLEGVQNIGDETQPNLEEIAKLKPDLIIASKLRHEEIYDQLTAIAPTVAHETVFEFKGTVELMGKAMNQEEKANEILSAWNNRVADFQSKIKEKLGEQWPLHVSVLNFRADHARVYVTGFAGSILSELGFSGPKNLQDPSLDVVKFTDKESISDMNADVFYLFMEDDGAVKKTYDEWTNHPLWKNLDAVKANQVHTVDEIIWNMGGGIKAANLMLDDIYDRFELEK
ncbi:iron-siderophore ABC transporter substrate-binding protein [Bacillus sp. B15-48]|uniref:ABC transporter substrate-binding protein n=1 Tax=Bacillus sp. B15-48 TaxID=1548601 RepID=UPI0019401E9F|nr:iron-siderophore ABC transporter substrate-binding protein [Bacillus sp. B15-48]MBM4765276.1 ABC transporter substrate-binding protein [Bacillus sp. B15-48]